MGQVALVIACGEDVLAALAHDDRRPGVLAHRQHAAGGDIGVLEQVEGDEPVVGAGLRIVEDAGQLGQVARPQQVGDVLEGLEREQAQRLGLNGQECSVADHDLLDALGRDEAVRGVVVLEGQHLGVAEVGHGFRLERVPQESVSHHTP